MVHLQLMELVLSNFPNEKKTKKKTKKKRKKELETNISDICNDYCLRNNNVPMNTVKIIIGDTMNYVKVKNNIFYINNFCFNIM